MLLIDLFWICLCFPGYALARRAWPGMHAAGLLAVIASSLLGSFLVLSPVSMLCYATGASAWVFSAVVALSVLAGIAYCVWTRADRALVAGLQHESVVGWLLLAGLIWLQARIGAYFSGDATFHLGRIRVLLEHGFTNRDIYLKEYHFQHIYHTNLLFPIYASASQLTGQSYLATWFHSQAFAKLLVAAGHYVLGFAVTRKKLPAWLLALTVVTANAGETYTTYPNTVAVGWLLPLQLAAAFALVGRVSRPRYALVVAACSFVMAQVHALYAVYAGLALGPGLSLVGLLPWSKGRRRWIAWGLVGSLAAVPFLAVSQFGFKPKDLGDAGLLLEEQPTAAAGREREERDAISAQAPPAGARLNASPPEATAPAPVPAAPVLTRREPPKWLPEVDKGKPAVPTAAVALGGGHLEKSLELDSERFQVWMAPEKMGGKGFVWLGFFGFALALGVAVARSATLQRHAPGASRQLANEAWLPLLAALLGALALALVLFWPPATTRAVAALDQPFTIARLSTVLSSLLLLGIAVGVGAVVGLVGGAQPRWLLAPIEGLVLVLAVGAATQLTGHAPMFFSEVLNLALRPHAERYATLDTLEARRQMLREVVPAGTTVLTTARFARTVVMLCDCYVIIADRGHTYLSFARLRRENLLKLNAPLTRWEERKRLLDYYGLDYVVFESRHVARLYRWSHEHGAVIGQAAGLEVVKLRR